MAAAQLYCVCRQRYDVSRFMIECDICKDWFHGSCVQVEEHHAADIDLYHCPNCKPIHGPSRMKKRNNWHRHDYTELDDGTRPVQAGTAVFVQELQARTFPSANEIVVKMQGSHVTQRYLEADGFHYPIVLPDLEGLGLKLPPPSFSVRDVEHYVGGDKVVDVIDVARQADSKMKLREFVKYYYQPERPKVLNLISLEFSDTKMAELVEVPDIVSKMSWVENYWPDDSFFPKPFVQKYCLMGVKDSYTDFHIDFGGTSVWYHVLWGEKIFYLIKPTKANLALYESWSSSPNQSEVFFGEKVDKCYKCVVKQGTTILLPTGWIHAVLTSQDCMAFGGNFLHNLNIGMQLRCYEMERRLKTPELFKFPYFEAISWYVAKNLLETLKELREDKCQPQEYLVEGVRALISALKTWLRRELTEPNSEVPDNIRPTLLIKELTKEIRHLEDPSKSVKSQGITECLSTRSSLERRCQARRAARRLRDHHHHHHHHRHHRHHQHGSTSPSNLDILELHTREVLRRLEVGPLDEGSDVTSKLNRKFKKIFATSAVKMKSSHDNALRLVLCNGRIMRERRRLGKGVLKHERHKTSPCQRHQVKTEKASPCQQERVKTESVEAGLETQCTVGHKKATNHKLRTELLGSGSDLESGEEVAANVEQHSSDSGSSEDEAEHMRQKRKGSGSCVTSQSRSQHHKPLKRERPTSPSPEKALQGVLSVAGLMCQQVPEEGAVSQEAWWSTQASSNSSNEAGSPDRASGSPREEYLYRESSLSPPLHPSKRHAHNPSPISNQATKGKRPKKGKATAKQRLGKLLKMSGHTRLLV
ncbi:LOW QUALITY PROTEIN: lysine-specific demethylase 7A [Colossoma macropomum]|uniref:LOW QUALITY PROTEIN: lysine-specific demethylase 7A n=1 Tax=Colossoma macropomum TaxID=42526 RepID=UPI001864C2BA|nr:LOW QUALITY PROTEIN: lysine-specific demethylase 7A [Colossoma macropomum]